MNDPWSVLLAVVTIAALVIALVDTIGADHLHKRALLRRIATYTALILLAFTSGWLSCRLYHQRDLDPKQDAANQTKKTQPDDAQITHEETPATTLEKPSKDAVSDAVTKALKDLNTKTQRPSDPKTHKHPTPAFILKTIEAVPPVAQQKVKEQFIGIPISWDGRLEGSESGAPIFIHVSPDDPSPTLSLRLPIELPKHNFLLQAEKGTHLHIEAVIDSIPGTYYYLTLKDVSVLELKGD